MKLIRNRADARWLPARFNFALSRLIAFAICRTRQPRPQPGLVLAIDRNQSAVENYVVAAWFYVSSVMYLFAALQLGMPRWAAAAIAIPATAFLILLFTFLSAIGTRAWREQNHIRMNHVVLMVVMTLISAFAVTTAHWTRFVGGAALVLLAVNAIAAVIVRLLQPRFAALERSFEAGV